jgi:hypothetical protein
MHKGLDKCYYAGGTFGLALRMADLDCHEGCHPLGQLTTWLTVSPLWHTTSEADLFARHWSRCVSRGITNRCLECKGVTAIMFDPVTAGLLRVGAD